MLSTLTGICSLAFVIFLTILVVSAIKKKPKKKPLIGLIASFAVFLALSAIYGITSPDIDRVSSANADLATDVATEQSEKPNDAVGGSGGNPPPAAATEGLPDSQNAVQASGLRSDDGNADPSETQNEIAEEPETSGASEAPAAFATYRVLRVIDGDTIEIDMDGTKEKVRFIGVDTPESVHPDEARNIEYGKIASEFTKSKLDGADVTLELDVQERDRYGRVLAYVYTGETMFNKTLLSEGHAKVATYPPNVKYVDDFIRLQKEAQDAERGVWQYESLETAVNEDNAAATTASGSQSETAPTSEPAGQSANAATAQYIGNSNTHKFHVLSCRYVSTIKPEHIVNLSERESAISAGYVPCKVCDP